MTGSAVAAVDLGATSGRVVLGHIGPNTLDLRLVSRFPNTPVRTPDGLHWNVLELYRSIVEGLRVATREEPHIASVGVDSWALDYALLRNGTMLATPFHYRDERNHAAVVRTHARVDHAQLFAVSGLQHLPFTTLFQLDADAHAGMLDVADRMLLIPDLMGFWLTGQIAAEATNASTTGLRSVVSGTWDDALIQRLGVPRSVLPDLVAPGTVLGPTLATVDLPRPLTVTTVGSHDTASAVVAVPSPTGDLAYVSCGTWGLVGVECEAPVLTDAAREANFTNELGVDGRVRFLRNVMGLWILNESVREWERSGEKMDLAALLAAAAALPGPPATFDVDAAEFLPPGDMTARIVGWYTSRGLPEPRTRAQIVRCIVESLAAAFADTAREAAKLSRTTVNAIHIVGGGAQNALLCQLVADRSGLAVLAGPVEATAIGNMLVQARAHGLIGGSLESMRAMVARTSTPVRYAPRP